MIPGRLAADREAAGFAWGQFHASQRSRSCRFETRATIPRPGRPRGSKDKVPRSAKASIAAIFREVASDNPELIREAVIKGLQSEPPKSFGYLQLLSAYVDGRPAENLKMEIGMKRITLIDRFADGTEHTHTVAIGPKDELDALNAAAGAAVVVGALPAAREDDERETVGDDDDAT